jgi:hypothetical protein
MWHLPIELLFLIVLSTKLCLQDFLMAPFSLGYNNTFQEEKISVVVRTIEWPLAF